MTEKKWHRRTAQETQAALNEQWGFLVKSCAEYDKGDESEAKRIANALATLLYDKGRYRSLLNQLDASDILFFDTATNINPANLVHTFGLVMIQFGSVPVRYMPPLANIPLREGSWLIPFDHWWKKPVVCVPGRFWMSRGDLILLIGNKDGGRHVDPDLPEDYYQLAVQNVLGETIVGDDGVHPVLHVANASIRQIAHEAMVSMHQKIRMIPPDLEERPIAPIQRVVVDAATGQTRSETVARKRMCMCNSGLEYKDCHAHGGRNVGRIVSPRAFKCPESGKPL